MESKRNEVDGIAEGHGYTIRLLFARRHVPEHKDIPPEMNGLRTESIFFVSNTNIYLFSPTFSPTKSAIKRLKIYYYRLVIIMITFYFDQYGFYSQFLRVHLLQVVFLVRKPNSSSSKASWLQGNLKDRVNSFTQHTLFAMFRKINFSTFLRAVFLYSSFRFYDAS